MEASKHPEMIMLNVILQTRKLKEVIQAGIRPDHFELPSTKEAFQYLIQFAKDPNYSGGLPTMAQFRRRFPWFVEAPVPEGVTPMSIAHDVIELSLQRVVTSKVFALQHRKFISPEDVEVAIQEMKDLVAKHKVSNPAKAAEHMALMETWYEAGKDKAITGVPYPWASLNTVTRGIQKHDFILVYGRPKHGKTWMLLLMLHHMLMESPDGCKIVFVSYEMDLQRLISRLGCIRAKLNYGRFNQGDLSPGEVVRMQKAIAEIKLMATKHGKEIIFAGPAIRASGNRKGFSIMDIEQLVDREKPIAAFVDGLVHAVDVRTGKRSREWSVVGNISSDTKQLALSLHCPVIASHWANRESEGTAPTETQKDIGYADALAQDADLSLRITKVRTKEGEKRLILQPEGAREFELLGISTGADFCEDLEWKTDFDNIADLKKMLARIEEDPVIAATNKGGKGGGGGGGGGKKGVSDLAKDFAKKTKKGKDDDEPIPPEGMMPGMMPKEEIDPPKKKPPELH